MQRLTIVLFAIIAISVGISCKKEVSKNNTASAMRVLGNQGDEYIRYVLPGNNGNWLLIGTTTKNGTNNSDIFTAVIDKNLNVISNNIFGGAFNDFLSNTSAAYVDNDSNILFGGNSSTKEFSTNNVTGQFASVYKINRDGHLLTSTYLPKSESEYFYSTNGIGDDGAGNYYIVASNYFKNYITSIYKLDKNLNILHSSQNNDVLNKYYTRYFPSLFHNQKLYFFDNDGINKVLQYSVLNANLLQEDTITFPHDTNSMYSPYLHRVYKTSSHEFLLLFRQYSKITGNLGKAYFVSFNPDNSTVTGVTHVNNNVVAMFSGFNHALLINGSQFLKTDLNGNVIWSCTAPTELNSTAYGLNSNGDVLVCGQSSINFKFGQDIYYYKISKDGKIDF